MSAALADQNQSYKGLQYREVHGRVISRDISRVTIPISIRGLITPLITTPETPSRECLVVLGLV